ncbi:MAG TPA: hypothetical protein VM510_16550 [Caulifigura sp.]|jgi:hypothetical protein|nr:hypothetical protein [Caulifigura sp.]
MTSAIVLTEEQERLLRETAADLEVRSVSGLVLGTLIRDCAEECVEVDPEVLKILIDRMSMKNVEWRTTDQVLERLKQIDAQCGE